MTANPASPRETNDTTGTKLSYGIFDNTGTAEAAFSRILNAAVVGTETHKSGAVSVASMRVHDATDVAALGPLKIGGYAKAAAPSDVSADADIVNAWFLRNGAQATVLTAAGALIGGDASNGLDVDVTRVTGTVTIAGAVTNAGTFATQPGPSTTGGLDTANFTSSDGGTALTGTAQVIKASAGQIYGWAMHNPNDETCYVNFYNVAAASVTVGTTNPLFQFPIPAGASANFVGAMGITFSNAGFSASATKTAGSATNPDTALEVVVFYK